MISITTFFRRFFLPSFLVSIYYYFKYGCMISFRAEVELNSKLKIGKKTSIGSFTKIKASIGVLSIGKNVSIATGCDIGSDLGGTYIGNDCLIGPHVKIIGNNYSYNCLDIPIRLQGTHSKGVKIEDNVWIGAGACILDGAEIGCGAIITPNSVVSSKIPQNTIVQGNPAKVIFNRR